MEGWMIVSSVVFSDLGPGDHCNMVTRFYSGDGQDIARDVFEWNPYWRLVWGLASKEVCLGLLPWKERTMGAEFNARGFESDQIRELKSLYWVNAAYNRGVDLAIGAGVVSVGLSDYGHFSKIYSMSDDLICFQNDEGTWRWFGPFRDKRIAKQFAEDLVSWNHAE